MVNLILIAVFAAVFFAMLALYLILRDRISSQQRKVRKRLDSLSSREEEEAFLQSLVRDDKYSKIPLIHRMLAKVRLARQLQGLIDQSGLPINASTLILAMLSLGGLLLILVLQILNLIIVAAAAGIVGVLIPYFYVRHKRKKRIEAFEELLPDAIDVITNALNVGFSFESALTMVADEIADPLGIEFAITFQEQNLGKQLSVALQNLRHRVPSDDLNLFITSLLIHKRTGGNLAEVLEKTARTVRDRFRFQREIKTKTAHSRLSGGVLIVLPLFMVGIIILLNPDYFMILINERIGNWALGIAIAMQFAGMLIIKHIVNIKL